MQSPAPLCGGLGARHVALLRPVGRTRGSGWRARVGPGLLAAPRHPGLRASLTSRPVPAGRRRARHEKLALLCSPSFALLHAPWRPTPPSGAPPRGSPCGAQDPHAAGPWVSGGGRTPPCPPSPVGTGSGGRPRPHLRGPVSSARHPPCRAGRRALSPSTPVGAPGVRPQHLLGLGASGSSLVSPRVLGPPPGHEPTRLLGSKLPWQQVVGVPWGLGGQDPVVRVPSSRDRGGVSSGSASPSVVVSGSSGLLRRSLGSQGRTPPRSRPAGVALPGARWRSADGGWWRLDAWTCSPLGLGVVPSATDTCVRHGVTCTASGPRGDAPLATSRSKTHLGARTS